MRAEGNESCLARELLARGSSRQQASVVGSSVVGDVDAGKVSANPSVATMPCNVGFQEILSTIVTGLSISTECCQVHLLLQAKFTVTSESTEILDEGLILSNKLCVMMKGCPCPLLLHMQQVKGIPPFRPSPILLHATVTVHGHL